MLGELIRLGPDQGLGRTSVHTGRTLAFIAQVTLDADPPSLQQLTTDNSVGADHNADPATNALLFPASHGSPFVSPQGPANARAKARGVLAMAAKDGHCP